MAGKIDDDHLRERIRRIISDVVGRPPASDDDNLRDIGVDSFKLIELATALEAEFSVSIPDENLQWCSMESVDRLSATIVTGLSANEAQSGE